MASAYVKFYNPDYLFYDSSNKINEAMKYNNRHYSIKGQIDGLLILENQNSILCKLFYNSCYFKVKEDEKLFQVYSNAYKKVKTPDKKSQYLIMEMRVLDEEHLKWLKEQFRQQKTQQKYKGPLSYEPVRQQRVSLLSPDSPDQNFRGFINLGLLILLVNHLWIMVENFIKYGSLLQNLPFLDPDRRFNETPLEQGILHLVGNILAAYVIQVLQFKNYLSSKSIIIMNVINISSLLIFPIYLIQASHPAANLMFVTYDLMLFMKFVSYAHTMKTVKHIIEQIQKVEGSQIPISEFFKDNEITQENLNIIKYAVKDPLSLVNFGHYCYFIAAPTYCFQFSYPRSQKIRKLWLAKRIVEFIIVSLFWVIIWYQYVEPILHHTYKQYESDNYQIHFLSSLERVLKLALPSTYLWITFFYIEFQLRSNILAELLRFADRQFYLEWWNCKNLGEYWKLWNIPVHQWLIRHVYFPVLKQGLYKWQANLVVFLASALAHEFVMCASLGIVQYWAFVCIMLQFPIIFLQERIEKTFRLQNSQLGNVMFWVSFCFFAQPLAIFGYYYRFLQKYQSLV